MTTFSLNVFTVLVVAAFAIGRLALYISRRRARQNRDNLRTWISQIERRIENDRELGTGQRWPSFPEDHEW